MKSPKTFISKNTVVSAIRWTGENFDTIQALFGTCEVGDMDMLYIHSIQGNSFAVTKGEWIVNIPCVDNWKMSDRLFKALFESCE